MIIILYYTSGINGDDNMYIFYYYFDTQQCYGSRMKQLSAVFKQTLSIVLLSY